METIDSTLKDTKERALQRSQQLHDYQYIHDTIAELQGGDYFQRSWDEDWPQLQLRLETEPESGPQTVELT